MYKYAWNLNRSTLKSREKKREETFAIKKLILEKLLVPRAILIEIFGRNAECNYPMQAKAITAFSLCKIADRALNNSRLHAYFYHR